MRKVKFFGFLAVIFVVILAAIYGGYWKERQEERTDVRGKIIPTVFVHGYKGTTNSFGHMLNRFGYDGHNLIAMRILVASNGKLHVSGGLDNYETNGNSAVQILFEDNRASLSRQTVWLEKAMRYLRESEQVKTINFVGHSMGGLAILSYLENIPIDATYPVPQKFIAIATPFQGINKADYFKLQKDPAAHDLKTGSDALKQLVKQKESIPKNIQVLVIAGDRSESGSDGLVEVSSVFFRKTLFPARKLSRAGRGRSKYYAQRSA